MRAFLSKVSFLLRCDMQFWRLNLTSASEICWSFLSFSSPVFLLLLSPVSTRRYRYLVSQDGLYLCPTRPGLASVLPVQWKEQMNWISTKKKKPTVLAGSPGYLSVVLTKTFQIFPLLDSKYMWLHACRHLLLVILLSSSFLKGFTLESKKTSSQLLESKGWVVGVGNTCPKKPGLLLLHS